MPKVLTKASVIVCAHQGTVAPNPSQSMLKVDGQAVLVQGDLEGASIAGCMTPTVSPPAPVSKPCTTVLSMAAGTALKLKANGKPVLLETATGTTDGVTPVPSNQWRVQSAAQTKLDTL